MKTVRRHNFMLGFTLIELLLVTALLSVVGLAIYSLFENGVGIWRRINDETVVEDVNLFSSRIARELRDSFQVADLTLRGSSDELRFPAMITAQDPQEPARQIGELLYTFDSRRGKVIREQRSYSDIYKDHDGSRQEALGHVKSFVFQYYGYDLERKEYVWENDWQKKKAFGELEKPILPVAVRMTIGIAKNEREQEYFTRTVSIPVGCCPTRKTLGAVQEANE